MDVNVEDGSLVSYVDLIANVEGPIFSDWLMYKFTYCKIILNEKKIKRKKCVP